MNTLDLLLRADDLLSRIAVRGDDAYLMVDARKTMKHAFDMMRKEVETHDQSMDSNRDPT